MIAGGWFTRVHWDLSRNGPGMVPIETKGVDSGDSHVRRLDRLQWKWWGPPRGAPQGKFTFVHSRSPTPPFPLELVSRTNECAVTLSAHHYLPCLDPKAYPVKTANRVRAPLLAWNQFLLWGFFRVEINEGLGRGCARPTDQTEVERVEDYLAGGDALLLLAGRRRAWTSRPSLQGLIRTTASSDAPCAP